MLTTICVESTWADTCRLSVSLTTIFISIIEVMKYTLEPSYFVTERFSQKYWRFCIIWTTLSVDLHFVSNISVVNARRVNIENYSHQVKCSLILNIKGNCLDYQFEKNAGRYGWKRQFFYSNIDNKSLWVDSGNNILVTQPYKHYMKKKMLGVAKKIIPTNIVSGYGHLYPTTITGRVLTIAYAIIGIPLFLIALTDFGKLFTRAIKFFWSFVRRLYFTGSCRKARKRAHVQVRHVPPIVSLP